ncbi:MAG: hypothetical protein NT086_09010 [Proteobacteria bacterium]|nr:hypothetical protein [Pseudomonadota bacterium]
MRMTDRTLTLRILFMVSLGVGLLCLHAWLQPVLPLDALPKPAIKQTDGSLVLQRSALTLSPPKAPHLLPAGSKEERRISIAIKPKPLFASDCAPVHLDLSLVRGEDGRRVVASSPDGEIISALDLPIATEGMPTEPKRWAAGASYGVNQQAPGLWLERDLGRVRLGLDLNKAEQGIETRVRLGWAF